LLGHRAWIVATFNSLPDADPWQRNDCSENASCMEEPAHDCSAMKWLKNSPTIITQWNVAVDAALELMENPAIVGLVRRQNA